MTFLICDSPLRFDCIWYFASFDNKWQLNAYLTDIDSQTQEDSLLLTNQMADQENMTEQLKTDNAMLWVQKMNEIQSRVKEIIYNEKDKDIEWEKPVLGLSLLFAI